MWQKTHPTTAAMPSPYWRCSTAITYITAWSMKYRNETANNITMFATDDTTQKIIVVNVIPPGQCGEAINAVFKTKSQQKRIEQFADAKLGSARIRPFGDKTTEEKVTIVRKLVNEEYKLLQKMFI